MGQHPIRSNEILGFFQKSITRTGTEKGISLFRFFSL